MKGSSASRVSASGDSKRSQGRASFEDQGELQLVDHLQQILVQYLERNPYASLSSIGRRSGVSEPTLRRIKAGQIKTAPTTSTVIKLLTYISGETSLKTITDLYRGPISDFLKENLPQIDQTAIEYDQELNEQLKDNTKYLIYKLAANSSGTHRAQVETLLGQAGLLVLDEMVENGLLTVENNKYKSHKKTYALDPNLFKEKFRFMSHFVSTGENSAGASNPSVHVNYSNSVNPAAYRKICKIQKNALAKIRGVMESPDAQGEIPLFCLVAIDEVSNK